METGFVWKGIHSNEKGLKIISLPNITTPEKREEKIIIPGRDGYLTQSDGSYEGEVKPVEFDYFDDRFDDIKQWLTGSGEVIFSNEPDRYYKARIINKLDLARVLEKFHSGIIQFDCQPFGYLQDELIEITNSTTIYNQANVNSQPYIKIYGNGYATLKINNEVIKLTNISDYIELDSEMMECYKSNVPLNHLMIGNFPIFQVGENNISWTNNISKIEIIPRWRCK
ncbi:distal tail protein Dit [Clostridium sporogenes]|uniref:distal tail protein Dit n=1 Tax=Clostridium sporogenes TaxID=1509 RepID=UPI0013C7D641|nr:distal tail protein Dit [Clostridium sporogenes]MCW6124242.1 phage tail family protein [Clostridium sporogenes]NFH40132.1 phage tail protein [Clostridium sporogenes]NFQ36858.1 phage tail protein [Clostridium sporogenes]NFQ62316.1 phage tail protein [Clostridium sporogenes]NFQ85409.1 phage tail protein [Clostridium sporogenes]